MVLIKDQMPILMPKTKVVDTSGNFAQKYMQNLES